MLENRVNPLGEIFITNARGTWMGNRGQLHGTGKTILRPFKLKAWLICLLMFKGRNRAVMSPNQYTELFFLDEATAFAAGHRPCFECRRKDYDFFKSCWLEGNSNYGFLKKTSIQRIDEILHEERIDKQGKKQMFKATLKDLPDGTFFLQDGEPFLIARERIHHWTPFGYEKAMGLPSSRKVLVLTPRSTVNAFRSGYKPALHYSLNEI
jgi:hypothetical protein